MHITCSKYKQTTYGQTICLSVMISTENISFSAEIHHLLKKLIDLKSPKPYVLKLSNNLDNARNPQF